MNQKELIYWLSNIKEIGAIKVRKLMDHFKEPPDLFSLEPEVIKESQILSNREIKSLLAAREASFLKNLEAQRKQMEEKKISFITEWEEDYPDRLRPFPDRPAYLYVLGRLPGNKEPTLGMVGARACTYYGNDIAKRFGREFGASGISVVSGLARGIDSCSQRGCLEGGGKTYAVLGSGLLRIYPEEHEGLAHKIVQAGGGLISEFPIHTPPLPSNFPMRNRIIAGLSDKLLVVEAKYRSGSLITVSMALDQGKDVFAIPGRIDDPFSQGTNHIIQNGASLVTHPQDICKEFRIQYPNSESSDTKIKVHLEKELDVVYSVICLFPKNIHVIIEETGMSPEKVLSCLMQLELLNLVKEPLKNYYARRRE